MESKKDSSTMEDAYSRAMRSYVQKSETALLSTLNEMLHNHESFEAEFVALEKEHPGLHKDIMVRINSVISMFNANIMNAEPTINDITRKQAITSMCETLLPHLKTLTGVISNEVPHDRLHEVTRDMSSDRAPVVLRVLDVDKMFWNEFIPVEYRMSMIQYLEICARLCAFNFVVNQLSMKSITKIAAEISSNADMADGEEVKKSLQAIEPSLLGMTCSEVEKSDVLLPKLQSNQMERIMKAVMSNYSLLMTEIGSVVGSPTLMHSIPSVVSLIVDEKKREKMLKFMDRADPVTLRNRSKDKKDKKAKKVKKDKKAKKAKKDADKDMTTVTCGGGGGGGKGGL
jgi:hypothetical protein